MVQLRADNISRFNIFLTESFLVDGGEVDEDFLRAIIGGDEAEALIREEFNLSGVRHLVVLVVK
jgi:hypothetical protein